MRFVFDEKIIIIKESNKLTGATGKTVAIIVGGAAGVGFLVICLLFAKNMMKKKHDGTFSLLALIHTCMYKHAYKQTTNTCTCDEE